MEVVPDYEDRGMKKWRPFYSSPELRLSLNSVMNEFKLPYQAPPQMTAEEIDQALTRAFRYQERVKVTLSSTWEGRYVYHIGRIIGRAQGYVILERMPIEYEDIRHVEALPEVKWFE